MSTGESWRSTLRGPLCGLAAALLFGASAPLAKLLLPGLSPLVLSGLLYVGAGLGLGGARLVGGASAEARLERRDLGPLAIIVLVGGMVSPALMLWGLARVSGVSGALLLNLEAPFTMALALVLFREHLGGRAAAAAGLIVLGGVILGGPGPLKADALGAVAIAGACLGWGLDNNLSQRLSLKDPRQVVLVKTLGAGTLTLLLATTLGHALPAPPRLAAALVIGALSYGVSLLLDMYALRLLGAAREAAFFATAPFMGAVLAVPVLGERLGVLQAAAGASMAAGVVLLIRDRHAHVHTHEAIEHEHLHVHDEHHRHEHAGPITEPHSHAHRHEPITHDHPHVSDLHHRHRH